MGLCDFEGQDQEACFQGGKEGIAERGSSYFNIQAYLSLLRYGCEAQQRLPC